MAEKSIIVPDADTGEGVACRDAVENDSGGNPRIVQLIDSAGRKSSLDGSTPTRTLIIPDTGRGDSFDLGNIPAEIESTALTLGDADSVVVAVQFEGNEDDSKIIVTPVIFDGINPEPIAVLEPKSFNILFDLEEEQILGFVSELIWNIDNGGTAHVNHATVTGIGTLGSMMMKPDGTKLIWSDSGFGKLKQGILSTPFDLSTYGTETEIAEGDYLFAFQINPEGTIMIGLKSTAADRLQVYDLSTPWDVTTAVDRSADVLIEATDISGFSISNNGLHMYVQDGYYIYYYTMSSAWDPSTLSYVGVTNTYSAWITESFNHIKINNDGTKFLLMDKTNMAILQLSFPTPYVPTGFTVDAANITFGSGIENNPTFLEMAADGSKLWFYGGDAKTIHAYNVAQSGVGGTKVVTPLQSWNSLGAPKIGFHIYHDSATKKEVTVDLFASVLSNSVPGYEILNKDVSGIAGSFPAKMQYGGYVAP